MNLARELGVKRIVAVFLIHCPILGEIQEADVATFQLINLVAGAIGESIFKLEDNRKCTKMQIVATYCI
jgi:hypothetical protein